MTFQRVKSLTIGACVAVVAMHFAQTKAVASEFELRIVSSRADTVSGDSVLVELKAPTKVGWLARLNGRDVTARFQVATQPNTTLLALLTGLNQGENTIEVWDHRNAIGSTISVINHPRAGPVFSGPQEEPFFCQTEENGLGPPRDSDCSAEEIIQYYYKSTESVVTSDFDPSKPPWPTGSLAPGFKAYDASKPVPVDVAQTVIFGRTVPYIVRREIGTINRGVYDVQFLHQPGQPLPTPWSHRTEGWNGRLIYVFGGGCGTGHHQGVLSGAIGALYEPLLSQGYAIATSTLNAFATNCNDRVSAEAASMVKEYFTKQFGKPIHTIGWGASGGAIQQYLIAQNYPGLLDGIIPQSSFPDIVTVAQSVTDCSLLHGVFADSKLEWSEEQKSAVSGWATWRACSGAWVSWRIADPTNCDRLLPKEETYDPLITPGGVRCDIYDGEINVLGRDPTSGFARRTLDNVGVQYGLVAFNSGIIDAEHFIELNEQIGGYDNDGRRIAARTSADAGALREAYTQGLVLTGGGGLGSIPIIDFRRYTDDLADAHSRFRTQATRARLIAANANASNQVSLIYPRPSIVDVLRIATSNFSASLYPEREAGLVKQMDRWLDNIEADKSPGTAAEKVVRNKPSDLISGCWTIGGKPVMERRSAAVSKRKCDDLYKSYGDPRIAAGVPLADDILKCELKPVSPADYSQPLARNQLERLRKAFPNGVCDYTRPGIGQQVTTATWLRY